MKNTLLKRCHYHTESNKSYTILADSSYDIDKGIELNPYAENGDIFDSLVVTATEKLLIEKPNFTIRNTEYGYFLEMFCSQTGNVIVVDKIFELSEIFTLIEKLKDNRYSDCLVLLKTKYGILNTV